MSSLPIIDLSAPDATSAIGTAARGIRFFCITGHGHSDAALAEIFAQCRRHFALSPAHLALIALTGQTGNRG